jgi:hypothetical protein
MEGGFAGVKGAGLLRVLGHRHDGEETERAEPKEKKGAACRGK